MNINLNKNVLAVCIIVVLFLGLTIIGSKVLIEKVSNRVIEEFRRDYAPGPYNPGFDPDKVDPNFFRPNQQQPQQQPPPQTRQQYQQQYQQPPQQSYRPRTAEFGSPSDWNRAWDQSWQQR